MDHDIAISILGQSSSRAIGAQSASDPHPLTRVSPDRTVRSLYLHVPFCFHKCHYCDFYSIVDSRDRQGAFTARMIAELRALAPFAAAPLETIFVGGGTPTLLHRDHWARLLDALHEHFDLSAIVAGRGEFTVECNPETADPDLFALLRGGGVDRLSMGAQSFQPRLLRTLERWHDPESVARAAGLARDAGIERLSVDLISAIPGQTLGEFEYDLDRALGLGISHLSCYTLTYEANTAMTKRLHMGEFAPADEDLEIAMQDLALEKLAQRGLERYEVSNYAQRGEECRHNLAYWRQEDWLAGGPSASGHVAGWRWKNIPRLGDYLEGDGGLPSAVDVEAPDAARALGERLMSGLRLREGVGWAQVFARAREIDGAGGRESGVLEGVERVRDRMVGEGYLEMVGGRLMPTASGFRFADLVAREFLGVLIDIGGR